MIFSFALIILFGLISGMVMQKIKLPKIIGMLLTGIILGPFVLNLIDGKTLNISAEIRNVALIIILVKAGLALNVKDLKKVGVSAVLLSFLPAVFEIVAYVVFAPLFFNISVLDGAIMGAVLSAVSPAVVVPRMVELMERGYGVDKNIPQLILAGASLDDVFVIVLFTTFIGLAQGGNVSVLNVLNVPLSIILGIALGIIVGYLVVLAFKIIKNTTVKTVIVLGTSFLMVGIEKMLEGVVAISGLLAVMSLALTVKTFTESETKEKLSKDFGNIWIVSEILLFVLVGSAVDIRYTLNAGFMAIVLIIIALVFRSIGVFLSILGTNLNAKERLYAVIAYLPKATVQAGIGAVPLSLGLSCGNVVLSVAVLSILITAPLGAICMDLSYKKLLNCTEF